MKNRFVILMLVASSMLLIGCESNTKTNSDNRTISTQMPEPTPENKESKETEKTDVKIEYSGLSEKMDAIKKDAEEVTKRITSEYNSTISTVGDTVDSYVKNSKAVKEWYVFLQEESDKLYKKINDNGIAYYNLLVNAVDLKDYKAWNEAMDKFYSTWNDTMDAYYKTWNDLTDKLYNKYSKILSGDDWSKMYSEHSNTWSALYSNYSDAWSLMYSNYSAIWSGLCSGEKDIDKMLENAKEKSSKKNSTSDDKKSGQTEQKETAKKESSDSKSVNAVTPKFKKAMDKYEEFFNEYVEFMKKFSKSTDTVSMLKEYNEYIKKYTETMQAMSKIDSKSLNNADAKYYTEVQLRINKKLMEVAAQ